MEPLFLAIEQADYAILHAVQASASPLLTMLMLAVTFLGNPVFWVGVAALLYWRGQENKGFFMMNLIVFVSAAAGVLKFVFARPRPSPEEFKVIGSDGYGLDGFPSGHVSMIMAAFVYCYGRIEKHWKILFGIAVLLVAYSRLYLGMHYPTDVLAGVVVGLVIGKLNLLARNKLFHKNFKPSKLEDELALIVLVFAAIATVFFLRSVPMAGLFIGFYAGFFLFKEMNLKQSILLRKFLALKYAIGIVPLLAFVAIGEGIVETGLVLDAIQAFIMYVLGGFWISWLWPVLFEKAFRHKKQ